VGRAFDKFLDQIPHWVWLSWIPQLLLSLQRAEAPHCKLVLLKIATIYPQVNSFDLCIAKIDEVQYFIMMVILRFSCNKISGSVLLAAHIFA
jgi:hypothetical protein